MLLFPSIFMKPRLITSYLERILGTYVNATPVNTSNQINTSGL